ncbi:MAG: hypothetical protein HY908_06170 [Myxococcales bacterium]|nr:hypothetical protein [Myxococcales bacterium]
MTRVTGVVAVLLGAACASPPPPPPPTPAPPKPTAPPKPLREAVETGKGCVKAESECDGGLCTVWFANDCDLPATCEIAMASTCSGGTSAGEATGGNRGTFPPGSKDNKLQAVGDCQGGSVVMTLLKSAKCR